MKKIIFYQSVLKKSEARKQKINDYGLYYKSCEKNYYIQNILGKLNDERKKTY